MSLGTQSDFLNYVTIVHFVNWHRPWVVCQVPLIIMRHCHYYYSLFETDLCQEWHLVPFDTLLLSLLLPYKTRSQGRTRNLNVENWKVPSKREGHKPHHRSLVKIVSRLNLPVIHSDLRPLLPSLTTPFFNGFQTVGGSLGLQTLRTERSHRPTGYGTRTVNPERHRLFKHLPLS